MGKAACVVQFAVAGSGWAGSMSDCNNALVMSTYNRFDSQAVDWRLASHFSEEAYNRIKYDAGGNAVIYGVPVGASYSDFQNRVTKQVHDLQTSLSIDQATNVMWTGGEDPWGVSSRT